MKAKNNNKIFGFTLILVMSVLLALVIPWMYSNARADIDEVQKETTTEMVTTISSDSSFLYKDSLNNGELQQSENNLAYIRWDVKTVSTKLENSTIGETTTKVLNGYDSDNKLTGSYVFGNTNNTNEFVPLKENKITGTEENGVVTSISLTKIPQAFIKINPEQSDCGYFDGFVTKKEIPVSLEGDTNTLTVDADLINFVVTIDEDPLDHYVSLNEGYKVLNWSDPAGDPIEPGTEVTLYPDETYFVNFANVQDLVDITFKTNNPERGTVNGQAEVTISCPKDGFMQNNGSFYGHLGFFTQNKEKTVAIVKAHSTDKSKYSFSYYILDDGTKLNHLESYDPVLTENCTVTAVFNENSNNGVRVYSGDGSKFQVKITHPQDETQKDIIETTSDYNIPWSKSEILNIQDFVEVDRANFGALGFDTGSRYTRLENCYLYPEDVDASSPDAKPISGDKIHVEERTPNGNVSVIRIGDAVDKGSEEAPSDSASTSDNLAVILIGAAVIALGAGFVVSRKLRKN
ncbi:MAG: hypothetical protein Q4E88_00440 [Coriobacteriia bacterium]|nr:hypothetical protein [Coriobacteriia bacterium]